VTGLLPVRWQGRICAVMVDEDAAWVEDRL
jgi:hypothetical protein